MIPALDLPAGVTLTADVRAASPGAQQEYRTTLAFERVLLGRLAEAMQATVKPDDDSASAATRAYADLLPDAIADALTAGGGVGLTDDLVRALRADAR